MDWHGSIGTILTFSEELDERLPRFTDPPGDRNRLSGDSNVSAFVAQATRSRGSCPTSQIRRDLSLPFGQSPNRQSRACTVPQVIKVLPTAGDDPGVFCDEAELVVP